MSVERELLKRLMQGNKKDGFYMEDKLLKEIEAILTQPEQKREPLSDETIADLWWNNYVGTADSVRNFARGIEKAHGIGGTYV